VVKIKPHALRYTTGQAFSDDSNLSSCVPATVGTTVVSLNGGVAVPLVAEMGEFCLCLAWTVGRSCGPSPIGCVLVQRSPRVVVLYTMVATGRKCCTARPDQLHPCGLKHDQLAPARYFVPGEAGGGDHKRLGGQVSELPKKGGSIWSQTLPRMRFPSVQE
jgi:hypothetical protein